MFFLQIINLDWWEASSILVCRKWRKTSILFFSCRLFWNYSCCHKCAL